MEKLPTAEEMFKANPILPEGVDREAFIAFMRVFARLHVEAALKEASEKAKTITTVNFGWTVVNKDSILNSYSLDNIK